MKRAKVHTHRAKPTTGRGINEREHMAFERILLFSDAVFAISITLLVLEMKVPPLEKEFSEVQFGFTLLQMIPNFVGFLISFFLIGQTWIEHHRMCSYLESYNTGMVWRNLWLLLFVAFLPFATALMSEYYFSRVAVGIYACSFAGLGLAKTSLWHYAVKTELLATDIHADDAARISRRVWATPIVSFIVLSGAAIGIPYAYCSFALIPLVALYLDRTVTRT